MGTEGGAKTISIEAMAEDVLALMDALGLEVAPVVGWSMGGFVTQRVIAIAPKRVEAAALLSTDPGGEEAVAADRDDWARLTDHTGTPREQASRLIGLIFPADLAPAIDRDFGELVADARAGLSEQALTAQEAAMEAWHATPQVLPASEERPPVLVAHGAVDQVIPAANAGLLAERWGASAEIFEGGGHAFMAQGPERLADLIKSQLAR